MINQKTKRSVNSPRLKNPWIVKFQHNNLIIRTNRISFPKSSPTFSYALKGIILKHISSCTKITTNLKIVSAFRQIFFQFRNSHSISRHSNYPLLHSHYISRHSNYSLLHRHSISWHINSISRQINNTLL